MKTKVIILSAFMSLLTISSVMAQAPVSATATVEVGTPLKITLVPSTELNFGKVTASAAAGTCVVATDATSSATGGLTLNGGIASVVAFDVAGKVSGAYAVALPSSVDITRTGGSETVTVGDFKVRVTGAALDGAIGALSVTGTGGFKIGGTLFLAANQADGIYTGQFPVTVAYN